MIEKSTGLIQDSEVAWEDLGKGIKRKVMAYDDNMMIVKVAFEKGEIGDLHHHPHTQASYIDSGVFELSIGTEKQILKAGDVYFVTPNIPHGALCLEEGILIDVFHPLREDFI